VAVDVNKSWRQDLPVALDDLTLGRLDIRAEGFDLAVPH
jgi:hypothetical protein